MPDVAKSKAPSAPGKWDRSDSYRRDFLTHNRGLFGCLYFCVYCGKPITRKNMQVDHCISINQTKHNVLLKLYFNLHNVFTNLVHRITDGKDYKKAVGVNVTYNLLPACAKCNNKKKDKGGIWIVRGQIGGTIWKIINAINNLCLWLIRKPWFQLILVGLAIFLVAQYVLTGAGILASIMGFFTSIISTIANGVATLFGATLAFK